MPDKDASYLSLDEAMDGLPGEFDFFRERWLKDVQPDLAFREEARIAAAQRAKNFRIYSIVVGIAIAAIGIALFHHPAVAIAGVVAGGALWAYGEKDLNGLKNEAKLMLVDPVAREFGMHFNHRIAEPSVIHRFKSMGLVPNWDRANFEDCLTGSRKDVPFEFFEAKLEKHQGHLARAPLHRTAHREAVLQVAGGPAPDDPHLLHGEQGQARPVGDSAPVPVSRLLVEEPLAHHAPRGARAAHAFRYRHEHRPHARRGRPAILGHPRTYPPDRS